MTSRRLFQARLEFLIEEEGIERVAESYGRSPATVQRWVTTGQTPSRAIQRSVTRRALDRGAARAIQVRERGQFTAEGTIATRGSQRAIESVNRELRRRRRAEMRRARRTGDERQLAMARNLRSRLTSDEEADLALRRERLLDSEVGIETEDDDYLREYDDWGLWRLDYAAYMSGLL